MYRIAESFAKKNRAKAIITGESLGQVASQTLNNLYVLSSAISLPILRPLVGLDKVEIEDIARDIGSYKITAKKTNGCTAVPNRPATRSNIKIIEELENELELIDLCYEATKNVTVIADG
jgi:thiamine biosynthesis protein ThiI